MKVINIYKKGGKELVASVDIANNNIILEDDYDFELSQGQERLPQFHVKDGVPYIGAMRFDSCKEYELRVGARSVAEVNMTLFVDMPKKID